LIPPSKKLPSSLFWLIVGSSLFSSENLPVNSDPLFKILLGSSESKSVCLNIICGSAFLKGSNVFGYNCFLNSTKAWTSSAAKACIAYCCSISCNSKLVGCLLFSFM